MILITGASGFLGQHLLQHLSAQNKKIRALYNSTPPPAHLKDAPGVEWVCCDLLDIHDVEAAMQGVEELYHCAAMVSFQPADREKMLHFNPESTANVVNEALTQGIRKMVYVSSVAALGRTGDQKKAIDEEAEWGESKYNSAYALSKYLAEMEVWRGIGEGLNACIVNPGIILGEGSWDKGSTQLMKVVYKEFPFYTNGVTSWVDVQDVVKASVMLMESDVEAERFIISAGNYGYREIFTRMAKALDKKPPRYYAGPLMSGIVWRLSSVQSALSGKRAVVTRETASSAHGHSIYNNSKFTESFPSFTYTVIEETIDRMARSFINSL